ncbi:MAG: DUF4843 domain-containing protein [Odoribacteraceae bacterium]|jgi:hypothetical protein|nr:DUF4843 domain-containing protein [Odoribacteraceae bacterium]
MKRIHYIIVTGALALAAACSEAPKEMFNAPAAIHFQMPRGDSSLIIRQDTIVYSFAFDLVATRREICIPVEVVGFAAGRDREYHVEITPLGDTREGVHHEPISARQVLPAGKTTDSIRVVFVRAADMAREAKKIGLTIRDGGDFQAGVQEHLHVVVQVSDILERPEWWNSAWNERFGDTYDPQIYRAWMGVWKGNGKGEPTSPYPSWWDTPQELTALVDLRRHFEEHETYYLDEPSIRIVIPYPN